MKRVCACGACGCAALQTMLPNGGTFIGQSYYAAIGYALPATLGVCSADPTRPVFLFIGDGAFQARERRSAPGFNPCLPRNLIAGTR